MKTEARLQAEAAEVLRDRIEKVCRVHPSLQFEPVRWTHIFGRWPARLRTRPTALCVRTTLPARCRPRWATATRTSEGLARECRREDLIGFASAPHRFARARSAAQRRSREPGPVRSRTLRKASVPTSPRRSPSRATAKTSGATARRSASARSSSSLIRPGCPSGSDIASAPAPVDWPGLWGARSTICSTSSNSNNSR